VFDLDRSPAQSLITGTMPVRTASITDIIDIALPKVFEQAQNTTANHQKNRVAIYKLHKEAASHIQPVQNGKSVKLVGERAFEDAFINMVNHVLHVKKGVSLADRVVSFIGGYVRFMNEKGARQLSCIETLLKGVNS
jgi:condensin complex subunit 3